MAFLDTTCEKCSKRFGWTGKMVDQPPCPKCGHKVPRDELEAMDSKFSAQMDKLIEKAKRTGQ